MNRFASRLSAAVALAAAATMAATPAFSAQLPKLVAPVAPMVQVQADDGAVLNHSRGWGRHPGYGRYHRNRGGIDGGDVLAGVLILGGIAAVAAAASNANKDRDYRDRDYRQDDYRYRQSQPEYRDQQDRYREGYDRGYSDGRDAGDDYSGAENDRQWNDDDYARARESQGGYVYGM